MSLVLLFRVIGSDPLLNASTQRPRERMERYLDQHGIKRLFEVRVIAARPNIASQAISI